METTEHTWATDMTRRRALLALGGMLAGSPQLLRAQVDPRHIREHSRVPGLDELVEVFDFEPVCFANMPRHLYDYMAQGADSEWTARRNRHVFDWAELVERPGVAVDSVDMRTDVLGIAMRAPIIVAPTGRQDHLHPTAEIGMYEAATATGTLMAVSHNSSTPQEDIAAAASGPRWIQLYPNQDLETTRRNVERFQDAGARAIIITVDQQAERYDRALHNRQLGGGPARGRSDAAPDPLSLTGPARYGVPAPHRMWYTWDYMERLRELVEVPVLMKGILTAEDARICAERGFDGVIVSNHGGRSLDYSPSTLEVLPEIVDEVNGRIPVLVDSGFRRGSDVLKALALGANAVCVGRAARWGLGAFGPAGAQRVLEILQAELRESMARTGRGTVAAVDRTVVRTDFP